MIIEFDLHQVSPKFIDTYQKTGVAYDRQLRREGFESAKFNSLAGTHLMEEVEYTWFVLRWT